MSENRLILLLDHLRRDGLTFKTQAVYSLMLIIPSKYRAPLLIVMFAAVVWFATEFETIAAATKLPDGAPGQVDFARDIQPILSKFCYECHGPEKQKGGLRLDQKAAALKGGDSGPLLVPGKSVES